MAEPHSMKEPWISTPLIHSTALSRIAGCQIYLKLENLQPSGSFKSRGIGNFLLSHLRRSPNTPSSPTHFYSSSGGNAGLACVHAAVTLACAATIIVPLTTSEYMMAKMRTAGATEVFQVGASWAEADAYLREHVLPAARARGESAIYVSPFDAPEIWEGNATLIDEVAAYFRDEADSESTSTNGKPPRLDAIVCSVGGGGLFCGVMQGLDANNLSSTPVLAVETLGADSFNQSWRSGSHVTLPAITSKATTLGAKRVADQAFEYGKRSNVTGVVLEDRDAAAGCLLLAEEERMLVELSCGVCVGVLFESRLKGLIQGLSPEHKVVVVVCGGAGVNLGLLESWKAEFEL